MRRLFIIAMVGVLTAISAESAFACSCAPPRVGMTDAEIIEARLHLAKSVFVGTVTASHRKTSLLGIVFGSLWAAIFGEGVFEHIATFRVETNVKNAASHEIRVTTGPFGLGSGLCGFMFENGKSYLVYAYGERELETNICLRPREVDEVARQELKMLQK